MYTVRIIIIRCINTLRPRQNGRHFADDIFKCILLNENVWIAINISHNIIPKVSINNIPALVQKMAWHRPGDKPLSEPMMVRLPTHICVTWPRWVKTLLHHIWIRIITWQIGSPTNLNKGINFYERLITWNSVKLPRDFLNCMPTNWCARLPKRTKTQLIAVLQRGGFSIKHTIISSVWVDVLECVNTIFEMQMHLTFSIFGSFSIYIVILITFAGQPLPIRKCRCL